MCCQALLMACHPSIWKAVSRWKLTFLDSQLVETKTEVVESFNSNHHDGDAGHEETTFVVINRPHFLPHFTFLYYHTQSNLARFTSYGAIRTTYALVATTTSELRTVGGTDTVDVYRRDPNIHNSRFIIRRGTSHLSSTFSWRSRRSNWKSDLQLSLVWP